MTRHSPRADVAGVVAWRPRCGWRGRALQALREERYPDRPQRPTQSLYVTSGTDRRRLTTATTRLAADLYWIRAIQYYGDAKLKLAPEYSASGGDGPVAGDGYPTAVSAARPDHHARSAVQHRVSVWRDFSRRAASRRRRAGRIWPLRCSKRVCAIDPISGSTCRTSGSCTTGGGTTTRRPPSGSTGPARCQARPGSCGRWRPRRWPRAATGVVARRCGSRFRAIGRDRLAEEATPSAGLSSSTRMDCDRPSCSAAVDR